MMEEEEGWVVDMVQTGGPEQLDLTVQVVAADGRAVFTHPNIRAFPKDRPGDVHREAILATRRHLQGLLGVDPPAPKHVFALDEEF